MAARVEPARVRAADARVLPLTAHRGPICALIIDGTGIPKKGKHSVGVARRYCGQLGKRDNCQVAVSLSVANDHASLPIAYRLYLSHEWFDDPVRRAQTGQRDYPSGTLSPVSAQGSPRCQSSGSLASLNGERLRHRSGAGSLTDP